MRVSLVGWFNDRFGEVRTMQIGTVALLLGLLLMPLPAAILPQAPAMVLFIVFLALVPVGTALLFPASTSLVSQRTDRHELEQAPRELILPAIEVVGTQLVHRNHDDELGPLGGRRGP